MKQHTTIFCSYLLFAVLFISCKQQDQSIPVKEPDVPQDFIDFYVQFHSDSAYQMDHILFPLDGRPANQKYPDEAFTWEKDSWRLHSFEHFDPLLYSVTRKVTDSALITEFILENSSGLGIKRRFAKFSDEWYLIYYDAMSNGM